MKKIICIFSIVTGMAACAPKAVGFSSIREPASTEVKGTNQPLNSEALQEISRMSQQQCRDALYLNTLFYLETENMTEEQRRDVFPQFVQQVESMGIHSPRPPPPPDSEIATALRACAEGK